MSAELSKLILRVQSNILWKKFAVDENSVVYG